MAGHGLEAQASMRLEPQARAVARRHAGSIRLAAIVATLAFAALLVLAAGASPFSVFYLVGKGAAGSQFALLETLTRATPLIFTGLAVAVAFRAKLWNIGAEAQLYIGARRDRGARHRRAAAARLPAHPVIMIAAMRRRRAAAARPGLAEDRASASTRW